MKKEFLSVAAMVGSLVLCFGGAVHAKEIRGDGLEYTLYTGGGILGTSGTLIVDDEDAGSFNSDELVNSTELIGSTRYWFPQGYFVGAEIDGSLIFANNIEGDVEIGLGFAGMGVVGYNTFDRLNVFFRAGFTGGDSKPVGGNLAWGGGLEYGVNWGALERIRLDFVTQGFSTNENGFGVEGNSNKLSVTLGAKF